MPLEIKELIVKGTVESDNKINNVDVIHHLTPYSSMNALVNGPCNL